MLPFVRGVDLSGNDFKVSGPGVRPTSLQAVSSAGARAGLRFLSRPPPGPAPPGTARTTRGGAPPRAREPSRNGPPVPPLRARTGSPGLAGAGRTLERRVTPGSGLGWGPPSRVPVRGSGPRPGRRGAWGSCELLLPPSRPSVPAPLRSHAQARP